MSSSGRGESCRGEDEAIGLGLLILYYESEWSLVMTNNRLLMLGIRNSKGLSPHPIKLGDFYFHEKPKSPIGEKDTCE